MGLGDLLQASAASGDVSALDGSSGGVAFMNLLERVRQQGGGAQNRSEGTKLKVQEELPKISFQPGMKDKNGEDLPWCPICMDEFHEQDDVSSLPCGHYFHRGFQEEGLVNRAGSVSCTPK
jgi:RING-like zinc finger